MIYGSGMFPILEMHTQIRPKNTQNYWIIENFLNFYANFGTLIN